MKKFLYTLLTLSVAIVSCSKENEIVDSANRQEDQTNDNTGIVSNAIPETINGILTDKTKTSYSDNGDFTWDSSDQVRLIVTEDLTTYSRQGFYTYKIDEISGDKKSATFISTGSAGALTGFDNSGSWKSTGFAIYPNSVLDRFSTPETHAYNAPWFTLARGNVSGAASDIILIGVNDDGISNFKFYTAMSILKVTLKNIPASAAAVKLCTSDKTNYPIDGDFSLAKDGSGKPTLTFLTDYVGSFKGYQKIDISGEGEIASVDYYFNVPAATYPANTLSIVIEDANGGQIMKRALNKELTLARNDRLDLPALSYSYSVSFSGDASAPSINWRIDCKRIRFCVSTNSTIDIDEFNNGYTFKRSADTGSYSGTYALSSFTSQKPTTTGQWYMHYILQSDEGGKPTSLTDANVVSYGTIPFFFITSDDKSSFVQQYPLTNKVDGTNFWHPGTSSNYTETMTLAVSDDCTKGNLKISELFGKTASNKPIYGTLSASDATSITFIKNGDDSSDYFFSFNGNYFCVAQSADNDVANATEDVVFTISDGPVLTSQKFIVMKYTSLYPASWNHFIYGNQLVFGTAPSPVAGNDNYIDGGEIAW